MQELILYKKCTVCGGDGIQSNTEADGDTTNNACTWPGCVNGYIEASIVTIDPGIDDVMDKCNDILDKCADLLEKYEEIKDIVDAL